VSDLKQDLASLRLPPGDALGARRRRRRWPAVAAVAVVLAALAGWRLSTRAAVVDTVSPTVDTGSSAGAPVLTASGYVVARRRAVVSAKIQGRLAQLLVEEGARVEEGQEFARLESADFEASLRRARAQVQRADAAANSTRAQVRASEAAIARAQADLDETRRQAAIAQRLSTETIIGTDQRDAALARVKVAEAALGQAQAELGRTQADIGRAEAERTQAVADVAFAEAQLQNTIIRAPFTGTVVRKMAEVGESVAPIPPGVNISTASGAIVALADLDTLEVEVDVAEANVARLVPEQPAEVIVEAFPDRKYRGVLRQVIPTADRTRATVMVKVTIQDKDEKLKPEMSAKVTFVEPAGGAAAAPAGRAILVPQTAIVTRDGASHVFVVADGAAQSRTVTLGGTRRDQVVVVQGLTGTETLIDKPAEGLRAGSRVRPRTVS
jgi:HlyD family secretion protein